jgi:hypothetical protein
MAKCDLFAGRDVQFGYVEGSGPTGILAEEQFPGFLVLVHSAGL